MKYIILFVLSFTCTLIYSNNILELRKQYSIYVDSSLNEIDGEKSLIYSYKLLEIANKLERDDYVAYSYLMISHDFGKLGNYTSGLDYSLKAAKIYEILNKQDYLGSTYNSIGSSYMAMENYNLAIQYLSKALEIHNLGDLIQLQGDDLTNIGEAYRLADNIDSAYWYFELAYNKYIEYEIDSSRTAYAQCNLGIIYLYRNETKKADSILNISFSYLRSVGDYYAECITNYELAKIEFSNKNYTKASEYGNKALELARSDNFKKEISKILILQAEISKQIKQFEKAFEYLQEYNAYEDSLVNDKVVSQMAEMRAEFEIGRKQTEVDYFKTISKARTNMLYVLSVGLILIFGLALFLYRINNKRKEANYLLAEYNEELTQKNEIIHIALQDKDVLMKEIHHRVKNNLQIISSIISLQNMRITDTKVQNVFSEMQRRILAISSIHQKLYQSESVSQINMKEYLEEVVESIHTAFNNNELNVSYEILVQSVSLSIDAAVSIGLIVNELTTNSYKYAFQPEKRNHLIIALSTKPEGCTIMVSDNGKGIPKDIDILQSNSLGLRMVNLLARQLKGNVNIDSDNGAAFTIFFEGMAVKDN